MRRQLWIFGNGIRNIASKGFVGSQNRRKLVITQRNCKLLLIYLLTSQNPIDFVYLGDLNEDNTMKFNNLEGFDEDHFLCSQNPFVFSFSNFLLLNNQTCFLDSHCQIA